MMTIKLFRTIVGIFLVASLLSACGKDEQMQELQAYVAQLKKMVADKSKNQTGPAFQLPKAVVYGTGPIPGAENVNGKGTPLERYSIRTLQFVGTISNHHQVDAYIMTPDNLIYQAKVGDIIGDNYGKITKIETDHIEVLQPTTGASTKPSDRIFTMLLKE